MHVAKFLAAQRATCEWRKPDSADKFSTEGWVHKHQEAADVPDGHPERAQPTALTNPNVGWPKHRAGANRQAKSGERKLNDADPGHLLAPTGHLVEAWVTPTWQRPDISPGVVNLRDCPGVIRKRLPHRRGGILTLFRRCHWPAGISSYVTCSNDFQTTEKRLKDLYQTRLKNCWRGHFETHWECKQ